MDYDYYGKRIVSCSSDRKLKIWQVENGKEWVLQTEWIVKIYTLCILNFLNKLTRRIKDQSGKRLGRTLNLDR